MKTIKAELCRISYATYDHMQPMRVWFSHVDRLFLNSLHVLLLLVLLLLLLFLLLLFLSLTLSEFGTPAVHHSHYCGGLCRSR